MPWYERPLVAVLRRQYAAAMRFEVANAARGDVFSRGGVPPAPATPCQLYVHIPFCEVLCPFCSFHRVRFDPRRTAPYFDALRREIARYHDAGFRFADVYVGGGTPTVDAEQLLATLAQVRARSPVRSISIETNPNHLDPAALERYRAAGVTRLSVGVQSFDDGLLEGMERRQKYGSGADIRERLTAAHGIFPTLNVDMIFNLPGQSLALLERDLDTLLSLGVDQVSFYPLMTARGSRQRMARAMGLADTALRHPMYERILDRLLPAYRAASAWCFSRRAGLFDEYIIDQDDYVGVGSGAFSYVGGTMYSTTFSLKRYVGRLEAGLSGIAECRTLSARERMRYNFLMRLFGGELNLSDARRRHGDQFEHALAPELLAMRLLGATRRDGDSIRLTRRGMYVWVLMMAEFFNAVNDVRGRMRDHLRAELDDWNDALGVDATTPGPTARVALGSIGRAPRRTA